MQAIMKPVDCTTRHGKKGSVRPVRIRYDDQGETVTINVDNIVSFNEVTGKERKLIYLCLSIINGMIRQFELMYDINKTTWYLYRM